MNVPNLSIGSLRLVRITCPCRMWQLQAVFAGTEIAAPLFTGSKRFCENRLRKMLLATCFQTQRRD